MLLGDLAAASASEELPITDESRAMLREKFFSDTIVIRTRDDSIGSLHTIVARTLELFRCALRHSVPLRAGIAYGSWFESETATKELFTGDALLRAYGIGETQQMMGVVVCDVVRERFIEKPFQLSSGLPVIKDYPVPVKGGGCQNRAVLNWPAICGNELRLVEPLSEKALSQHFYSFGRYETLDSSAKAKYSNTVGFIQAMANHSL